MDINFGANYFTTTANYDTEGTNFTGLLNDGELNLITTHLEAQYGLNKHWGMSTRFDFVSGQSNNNLINRSSGKLTDAYLALNYRWKHGSLRFFHEFDARIPITTFEPNTDEIILNEGALAGSLKSWAEYKAWKHRFYAMIAFTYQDDGRASLLPWSIGFHRNTRKYTYGAEIGGHESITDDESALSPSIRFVVTDRVNSSSRHFYSVNPSLIYTELWAGYRFKGKFLVRAFYNKTLTGKNSAEGQTLGVDFKWRTSLFSSISEKKEEFQIKN